MATKKWVTHDATRWYRRILKIPERNKKPFGTFTIGFEEAKQYRRKFLNVLTRESQWEEIIVDVYL